MIYWLPMRVTRGPSQLVIASFVLALALAGRAEPSAPLPVQELSILSDVYSVDRIYRSMVGPSSVKRFAFDRSGPPELVWITGYRAEIIGEDGSELSPEFMCHSNLDFVSSREHTRLLRGGKAVTPQRLFTASQGQMDVRFPEGFGIPVLSNEAFNLWTQVLNLNPQEEEIALRHRTTIEYVRDRDAGRAMTPLYQFGVQGMVLVDGPDGFPNVPEGEGHGTSCAVGDSASPHPNMRDRFGRQFAPHWVVEPGRHVYHTPVTEMVRIPAASTRIHHIAVHLHPFAESVELRDVTTGETLFKSRARNREDAIGLLHVESFSSVEGLPIHSDHHYEVVTVYDNTSGEPQDSMATLYIYAADPAFRHPLAALQGS